MFISHFIFFLIPRIAFSCLLFTFIFSVLIFESLLRSEGNLQGKVPPKATMSPRTKHHARKAPLGLAKPQNDLALPASGPKDPRLVERGAGNQRQKDRASPGSRRWEPLV